MEVNLNYIVWIIILPFAAFLINGLLSKRLPNQVASAIASLLTARLLDGHQGALKCRDVSNAFCMCLIEQIFAEISSVPSKSTEICRFPMQNLQISTDFFSLEVCIKSADFHGNPQTSAYFCRNLRISACIDRHLQISIDSGEVRKTLQMSVRISTQQISA